MPFRIEKRGDEYCVVGPNRTHGCHKSRAQAIKQQRALYANEAQTAAIYEVLDAETPEEVVEVVENTIIPDAKEEGTELVKVEIGQDTGALTAALFSQMERMNERQQRNGEALLAALQALGERELQMPAPHVTIEPTVIPAPEVTISPPQVNVEAPQVTVRPEIIVPERESRRTVTVKRGPDGRMTGAEIEERPE